MQGHSLKKKQVTKTFLHIKKTTKKGYKSINEKQLKTFRTM